MIAAGRTAASSFPSKFRASCRFEADRAGCECRFRVIAGETWVDSLTMVTEEGALNVQVTEAQVGCGC